ncbi:hypothetical protein DFQ28_006995 [Apophysomyces sp. BC1034]|nr:hypothetical protein DFQ30_009625 [Apophysomyces sp. BC1015]KAG0182214.1 hypothetical protein DFQ29_005269 [Apophysomyces sp. BC1021]KAG0192963.1 hypothetical protein DFQ28_006995 [Apophysomyces sp. BC1034]
MIHTNPDRFAWVIVLTSDNEYVKGVLALAQALLRRVKTQYPLLVLHTDAVSLTVQKQLTRAGCRLKQISSIQPSAKVEYFTERFADTWTKLAVWDQDEFDRLVLLDADMLPCQNMDELMTMSLDNDWIAACHACTCNPLKIKAYPADWVSESCAYTHPATVKRNYFNSGLIVLTPSRSIFQDMLIRLHNVADFSLYPFPDQDFLNEVFHQKWESLPYTYNALKTLPVAHSQMWDLSQVKNIHYILSDKPWTMDKEGHPEKIYEPLYHLWWESYKETMCV